MNINESNTHSRSACSPIGKWLINHRLRKLKLDVTQQEKLHAMFAMANSARKDQVVVRSEVQESIAMMMAEGGYDREKAAVLIRSAAEQHADRTAYIANAFVDVYEGLEPWQQQQVLAMWQKRRHCRSHRCH